MVRHGAGEPKEDVVLKIKGPWVHRVMDIQARAQDFVEVLRMSGAGVEELAVALVSIVADLEREANTNRRKG